MNFLTKKLTYLESLNSHAPDRFTSSRARCAENCGAVYARRLLGKKAFRARWLDRAPTRWLIYHRLSQLKFGLRKILVTSSTLMTSWFSPVKQIVGNCTKLSQLFEHRNSTWNWPFFSHFFVKTTFLWRVFFNGSELLRPHEALPLPNKKNDSSIEVSWWVDLGKAKKNSQKNFLRFYRR